MVSLKHYDANSDNPFQIDLRSCDLSGLDLSNSLSDLLYASFDDRTVWPPADHMSKAFNWRHIIELGKNPGLGVRSLHARGVTGRGVSIAVIDQPLLTNHQEYVDRLQLYEEINVDPNTTSQMHGPAVASIALGKTVGTAPEAMLYYIGSWVHDYKANSKRFTFRYRAKAVRRILEVNERLPDNQKIRVLSMSVGWLSHQDGYDDIVAAVDEAKAAGMLVVSSSIEQTHGYKFQSLGRHPLADPDIFTSYTPALWYAKRFYTGGRFSDRLLIPTDSRTVASPTGADEYVFYRQGGWSWTIPYIAGVYALAAQADTTITPERFWSLALETGRTIELEHEGEAVSFGPIIDPVALIESLEND